MSTGIRWTDDDQRDLEARPLYDRIAELEAALAAEVERRQREDVAHMKALGEQDEERAALAVEVERLQAAINMTHACPVCPEHTDNPVLRARIAELERELEAERERCAFISKNRRRRTRGCGSKRLVR
jgi:septal ring factor EnvC (AmiA/AmiB activator)